MAGASEVGGSPSFESILRGRNRKRPSFQRFPLFESFLKTRERVCNDRGREKLRVCRTFHLFAGAGVAEFDTFRPTRMRFRAKHGIGIFLERFTSAIEIFCRRRKRLFVLRKGRIKITRYEKSSKPRKMYPLEKAKSFLAVVSNDKSRK